MELLNSPIGWNALVGQTMETAAEFMAFLGERCTLGAL